VRKTDPLWPLPSNPYVRAYDPGIAPQSEFWRYIGAGILCCKANTIWKMRNLGRFFAIPLRAARGGGLIAPMTPDLTLRGFQIYERLLSTQAQQSLVDILRVAAAKTPPFRPVLPGGKRMSVRMTSFGRVGWVADSKGYRYATHHPNGIAWPAIPAEVLKIWDAVSGVARRPDCCLMNYYAEATKMGMHQDRDEGQFQWPVVSVSLGDDALFRMEGRFHRKSLAAVR